ncbi:MAG: CvpA family protein [Rhodocyclales bacterium]|nr:CvpA family protein [Rhodocyclales bacterium]
MTIFDYAVFGIVGASSLLGLWRGVIAEVLALAAWIVAFIAARALGGEAATYFEGVVAEPALRYAAGFVAVLLFVLVCFAVARLVLSMVLKAAGLAMVDRLLGAGFGILRGVLIVLVGVLLAGMTTLPKSQWWRNAWLAPPLETAVIAAKPWLPAEVAKRIQYR